MADFHGLPDVRHQKSTSPLSGRQLFKPEKTYCKPNCSSSALDHQQNATTDFVSSKSQLLDILKKKCDKHTFSDLCSMINDFSTEPAC